MKHQTNTLLLLLVCTLAMLSSSELYAEDKLQRVPLHFWVVTSSHFPEVSYNVSDTELKQYTSGANLIWQQAGIEFFIDSITRIKISETNAENLLLWLKSTPRAKRSRNKRFEVLDASGQFHPKKRHFNVVLMKEWGPVVGNTHFKTSSIFIAEKNLKGEIRRPTILAHELGHALGLAHPDVPNSHCNLMKAGQCGAYAEKFTFDGALVKTLHPCQIDIAKQHVKKGFAKRIDSRSASCV